jgi:hypothetical protein
MPSSRWSFNAFTEAVLAGVAIAILVTFYRGAASPQSTNNTAPTAPDVPDSYTNEPTNRGRNNRSRSPPDGTSNLRGNAT